MIQNPSKAQVLRGLRTLHTWLGVLVVPWVIIIGATGFYLNHSRTILSILDSAPYDESLFADWPGSAPVDRTAALATASGVWPDQPVLSTEDAVYHDKSAYIFVKDSGKIIVTKATGHYFVKTSRTRSTYAPDGERLHRRIYWGSIFKQFHTDGWLGGSLGSWAADITSIAMILFGITGMIMWWMPRAKRFSRAARFSARVRFSQHRGSAGPGGSDRP